MFVNQSLRLVVRRWQWQGVQHSAVQMKISTPDKLLSDVTGKSPSPKCMEKMEMGSNPWKVLKHSRANKNWKTQVANYRLVWLISNGSGAFTRIPHEWQYSESDHIWLFRFRLSKLTAEFTAFTFETALFLSLVCPLLVKPGEETKSGTKFETNRRKRK